MDKKLLMAWAATIVACEIVLRIATAEAATTEAQRCEAAKLKAIGKYHFCLLKAERKAVLQGGSPDYSACATILTNRWTAAESSFGLDCPTFGDQTTRQSEAMADAGDMTVWLSGDSVFGCPQFPATGQTTCWNTAGTVIPCTGTGHDGDVQAGGTLAYVDNGDGTITDQNTGLMWEKLSYDGSIHDRNGNYTWANAFAVKVATLNSTSFAGYNDWRLPNVTELLGLLNYEVSFPAVSAAFNSGCVPLCTVTTCSCVGSGLAYWSSTTRFQTPSQAWRVAFFDGLPLGANKTNSNYVRAVRGGL